MSHRRRWSSVLAGLIAITATILFPHEVGFLSGWIVGGLLRVLTWLIENGWELAQATGLLLALIVNTLGWLFSSVIEATPAHFFG